MGVGKKSKKRNQLKEAEASLTVNSSISARNLRTSDLGGFILGCKHTTFKECMQKQLFGLPVQHFSTVKKITHAMPLFLFNFTDRKLHGIFEAVGKGRLSIDSSAWTTNGEEETPFPAQVQFRVRTRCHPLSEDAFGPIIEDNYFAPQLFWNELDHNQAGKLINLFLSSPWIPPTKFDKPLSNRANWNTTLNAVPSSSTVFETKNVDAPPEDMVLGIGGPFASFQIETNDRHSQRSWSSLFKNREQEALVETNAEAPEDMHMQNAHNSMEIQDTDNYFLASEEWSSWESEGNAPTLPTSKQHFSMETEGNATTLPITKVYSSIETESQHSEEWSKESEGDDAVVVATTELQDHTGYHSIAGAVFSGEAQGRSTRLPTSDLQLSDIQALLVKLMHDVGYLKGHQLRQGLKNHCLEQELAEAKLETLLLRNQYNVMASKQAESSSRHLEEASFTPVSEPYDCILVVGGFDGSSWLSDFSSYSPSRNLVKRLPPLTSIRSYTSAANVCGELYLLGGEHDRVWYDTVESYNPASNEWIKQPSLNQRKGSLASLSIQEKIYAIGGGNGSGCFSEVEMLDASIGKWIFLQPMQHKRFAPAAASINRTLYVVGGYSGEDYLKSVERFDPREQKWTVTGNMSSKRACHSAIALNEKIYALGGYNGREMVQTVEVFDPRACSFMMGESMNVARGYAGAVVLGEKIYIIGGMKDDANVLESIECYKEGGNGWQLTRSSTIGKRCFFSTHTL